MKITAAALQMPSVPLDVAGNCERADALLRQAQQAGAELAVLPEMFNTGYGWGHDFAPIAESAEGPTIRLLRDRAAQWKMTIAAGFVEHEGHHLYDSLGLFSPDGQVSIYRKRHLVFWERFKFLPGRQPLVVRTPFGRVGFAVCADMIYRRTWDDYRDRIDLAVISSAWPEFAHQHNGRKHWLFGHIGHLSGEIPGKVGRDLGIPVIFANQSGLTRTTIPMLGTLVMEKIKDRFAGLSSVCDGNHGAAVRAGTDEQVVISSVTIHPPRGPKSCHSMYPSGREARSSGSVRSGSVSPRSGSTGATAADAR